jgi:hypothetical protein
LIYGALVIIAVAVLGCAVLAGLAVFQAFLMADRPWGRFAWGGQRTVLPTGLRIGSAVNIAVYVLVGVLILSAAGAVAVLPDGVVDVAI